MLTLITTLLISVVWASWIIISQTTFEADAFPTDGSKKITPTITATPTLSSIYQGENATVTGGSANVAGTFSVNTTACVYQGTANTSSQTVNVTFTPTNTTIYKSVTTTATLEMLPIAYNGRNYYGTVESAIQNSTGGTIYVYTFGASANLARTQNARTIRNDVVLQSNTTLSIPYDNQGSTLGWTYNAATQATDSSATNQIFIADGKTLTVNSNAKINVGGYRSGGGGAKASGLTTGNHGQIILQNNSHIVCNGEIDCHGFIKSTYSTSSVSIENGGQLKAPFVVYDFRGGTVTTGIYYAFNTRYCVPFNEVDMPNITVKLTIYYGGRLIGVANLYSNNQHNIAEINVVGSTSEYLIQLTNNSEQKENDSRIECTRRSVTYVNSTDSSKSTTSGGCILSNNKSNIPSKDLGEILETIVNNYFYIISEWKKHFPEEEVNFYC